MIKYNRAKITTMLLVTLFSSQVSAKKTKPSPVIHTCKKTDSSRDILACALYHEGGNQGYKGMQMIGEVILNRTQNKEFPSSVKGVVYQPYQFSYLRGDKRVRDKSLWVTAQTIANNLLVLNKYSPDYRKVVDNTSGSLYFKTTKSRLLGLRVRSLKWSIKVTHFINKRWLWIVGRTKIF